MVVLLLLALSAVYWKFYSVQTPVVSEGVTRLYQVNNLPNYITWLISDPLVVLDKNGYPQPKLAASWKANKKSTIYTFKIKRNIFWQDGTPVKSTDLLFSLPDVDVSYPDDQTIQFKLADSFARFPTLLTDPIFKKNTLIGTGRYEVTETHFYTNTSFIVRMDLQPVASFSFLPNIVFHFYPDEDTTKTAFDLGEIDSVVGLADVSSLTNEPSVILKQVTNFNKIVAVFYDNQDKALSDKNLRKALSFAAPVISGEVRAKTPIPPFSWGYNGDVIDYLNNDTQAKSYLSKAKDASQTTIILTSIPPLKSVGKQIIAAWNKVGIKAVLRVESGNPQNFQALLTDETIPEDPDQYALWHSTQTQTNITNYQSKRVDDDLEKGRKLADFKTRQEKYFDFQKILLEDAPATFLYFPKTNIIYRKKVAPLFAKILPLQINSQTTF